MSFWIKWLLSGLVVVTLLTWVALSVRSTAVDADLASRVRERLDAEGHNWATLKVAGRVVTLNGTAPSDETKALASAAAGRVWGVRTVVDESGLIPLAEPYRWRIERTPGGVTLTGFAPSDPVRGALRRVAEEAFPGALFRDQTELARGAPEDFAPAAAYVLRALTAFNTGHAEIIDASVSIAGVAPDIVAFESAEARIREGMPRRMTLASLQILPPRMEPYNWSAALQADGVTLSGAVPNAEARAALRKMAAERFPNAKVTDAMIFASGEPEDFAGAATFALDRLKELASGSVQLSARAFTIDGVAASVDQYEATEKLLASALPNGLTLADNKLTPAVVTPYVWKGERTETGIMLSGYVLTQRDHDIVIGAAQAGMPNVAIQDGIRVAAGAPKMDWIGAVKFGVDQLSRMRTGSAAITDQTYEVSGEAASSQDYLVIARALEGTLPASLRLGAGNVIPPKASPYRFLVQSEADRVLVAGYAPTEADRQALLASAARKFGALPIVDNIELASGAPEDFVAAAEAGLQAASRLAGSRVDIVDKSLSVNGAALYPAAADRIKDAIESAMPRGYSGVADILIAEPEANLDAEQCQVELRNAMKLNQIAFAAGESQILPDSDGLLDRLVATIQRCPDAVIEVGGHTDSDGSPPKNLDLSKARAEAVVSYLASAGVLRERLTAAGYGETRPIASNSTPEGKLQNRRIEFIVREP
jgi:OOP family OmpA-OmpF porin